MGRSVRFRKNHVYGDDHEYENYFDESGNSKKTNAHKQEARKKRKARYVEPLTVDEQERNPRRFDNYDDENDDY